MYSGDGSMHDNLEDFKVNTSNRLKYYMRKNNLQQKDILEKTKPLCIKYGIKLEKSDLSQYVSGKVQPSQKKVSILAKALGVSPAWLLGYDVPMEETHEDELDILYNQYKKYLTKDDIDHFMYILKKRREENERSE